MSEQTHESFLRLYQKIHEPFARYCASHAYGIMDTEDLIQETVLSTLQNFDKIREQQKLLGYMITTANNILRNHLRRRKFSGPFSEKSFRKLQAQVRDAEVAMDVHHLYKALNELPLKDKEAILLFEINGLSIDEIATIQEASAGATKTRLSRARDKLRKLLEDDESRQTIATQTHKLFSISLL